MTALEIRNDFVAQLENLNVRLTEPQSKLTKTGKFRFSQLSQEIDIFGSKDTELLVNIYNFLDHTNPKLWQGISANDWKKDLDDSIFRLEAEGLKKDIEANIKAASDLMGENDKLKELENTLEKMKEEKEKRAKEEEEREKEKRKEKRKD